jgi:outer membrane protein
MNDPSLPIYHLVAMVNQAGIFVRSKSIQYRWQIVCAILSFVMVGPVQGVDLLGVYNLAIHDDPELRRAQQEHLASSEIMKQAHAGFLPTLTFEAESGKTRQDVQESENEVFSEGASTFTNRRLALTLNMPLYRHANMVNLRQARAQIKRADLAFENAKQTLLIRVATLYFEALAAEAAYDFSESERLSLQSHFDRTQLQRLRGLASITDLYEAQARLAAVEARAIEAEDDWDDALQALRGLNAAIPAGLSNLKGDLPTAPPEPDDVDLWETSAMESNLALLTQRQAVEIARQEVQRFRAARLPELNLLARNNWEKNGETLFGGGSDIETANFLVRLNFPIYQGGMALSRTREATYNYRAALEESERQRREVVRAVRAAFYGVKRAISRSKALRQAVDSQALALNARQEGYRSGRFNFVEVLDAERDLFEARRDHARARYDYILESLRLKFVIGSLNETDLVTINDWLE